MKVVIVGAGPGGLVLALTLSQFGIKPILIDKEKERSHFTKALTLQPRTLELMQSFHLLERFKEKGNLIRKTQFFANKIHVGSIEYGNLPSSCGFLLSITQPESESILESALKEKGIVIQRGVGCTDVEIRKGKAFVKVERVDSQRQEVYEADYVIAADGGKSTLRSLFLKKGDLQLTHEVRYDSNFIMGDFRMENYPFPRDERYTYFKNRAIYALIPMTYPYVRVVAFGLQGAADLTPRLEEFSFAIKEGIGTDLDITQGEWLSRFYPSRFMLNRFRLGPLFFLGDAAHIVSPIGAQGINLSIEDAYNLGWKLGMVICEKSAPSLLDTYSLQRMKAAQVVLEETNQLHKNLSNPIRNFFFLQQLKFLKRPEISRLVLLKQTQFFIDYPETKKTEGFSSGMRLFNVPCIFPDQTSLFDHLSSLGWTFLVNLESEEKIDSLPDFQPVFSISSKSGSDLLIDEQSTFCKRLKKSPPLLVISPDRYIFKTFTKAEIYDSNTFSRSRHSKKGNGHRPISQV